MPIFVAPMAGDLAMTVGLQASERAGQLIHLHRILNAHLFTQAAIAVELALVARQECLQLISIVHF